MLKISIPLLILGLPVAQYPANHNLKKDRSCRRRDERPRQGPSSRPQFRHGYCGHRLYTHSHQPLHCTSNVHNPRKGYPYRCPSPFYPFIYKYELTFPCVTQTFGSTLYGPIGFLIYTIAISLSAVGSINSNIFAIGRLATAASRRDYIPRFLAGDNSLGMSVKEEERWLQVIMQEWWPGWIVWCVTRFARVTWQLRVEKGVPM